MGTDCIDDAVQLADLRRMCATGEARRIRLDARLTVPEIARAVGVSHPSIYRWESGRRTPTGTAARRYGALLVALARKRVPA
jgi:DNA-binding transcriptional regulator YiaG